MSDRAPEDGAREALNPYASEVGTDPHPFYRALRRERVHSFLGLSHLVARYEDVRLALRHPEVFSSDMESIWIGQERPLIPLQVDPPFHASYRRMIDPLLSPSSVAALEDDIRSLANEILDAAIGSTELDFHRQFSMPFPCTVFLRLLGLPIDRAQEFVQWKDAIIRPDVSMRDVAGAQRIREEAAAQIYAYFDEEIDARLAEPRDDWLTKFVQGDVDGRPIDRAEVQDICFVFMLGGLDSVTAVLDCSVAHLASDATLQQRIREQPSALPSIIEELLRYETPVAQIPRVVRQPYKIGEHAFRPGERVLLMLGAANTDPAEFDDPEVVDPDREVNRHIAFGAGPHRCVGSHLARLELRVAMEVFHQRVRGYTLPPGTTLAVTPVIREIPHLPLALDAPLGASSAEVRR
jgi:cytochrome P450